jgi:hypothetical protein
VAAFARSNVMVKEKHDQLEFRENHQQLATKSATVDHRDAPTRIIEGTSPPLITVSPVIVV